MHDCSVPKLIKEVDFTLSLWMLNCGRNIEMVTNMCKMHYINTKPGGKALFLVATLD